MMMLMASPGECAVSRAERQNMLINDPPHTNPLHCFSTAFALYFHITPLHWDLVLKKVSDSVAKKIGFEKSIGFGIKKVLDSVSFRFWVSSHTAEQLIKCKIRSSAPHSVHFTVNVLHYIQSTNQCSARCSTVPRIWLIQCTAVHSVWLHSARWCNIQQDGALFSLAMHCKSVNQLSRIGS